MREADEQLISKKDLLRLTGISYGQLYRWKRQNLIPEAWFIKQSAFTGQETFFPKDKILKRVQTITDLKDQYSLEELADLLSPSTTKRNYNSQEICNIPEFSRTIVQDFERILNKDKFTYRELVFIYLCSLLQQQNIVKQNELEEIMHSGQAWLPELTNLSYMLVVCRREDQCFAILIQQQGTYLLDHKTSQVARFDLEDLSKDLNLKLNNVLEGK